ncbi:DNA primase catalytic subunit PriS [Methanosarcinales archaeon]|nr:MAG: DNA primase catalytic subunit PriS [Methanosarcinales archaeon]
MNYNTVRFLRRMFASYYKRAGLSMPRDFWMREWGFIPFGVKMMSRHRAFRSAAEIRSFLRENAPAHVFFSSAIYERPSAANMADKGWRGADLIFDLDADHIIRGEISYDKMLERVKVETAKLIDFLVADFGIDERDMEIVFSGARGYHVHVCRDDVRALRNKERREIVDYLSASGLDSEFRSVDPGIGSEAWRHGGGWRGRIFRGLMDFFREIKRMDKDDAVKALCRIDGVGVKSAMKVVEFMAKMDDDAIEEWVARCMLDNRLRWIPGVHCRLIQDHAVSLRSMKTDAPVTSDIHRLIRMPTSLHGKTGLIVKPLSVKELDDFEPLEDAVAFSSDRTVRVKALKRNAVRMKGHEYAVEDGEEAELPVCAAVYFMCRGVAEICDAARGVG